jgi:hypothetical protein
VHSELWTHPIFSIALNRVHAAATCVLITLLTQAALHWLVNGAEQQHGAGAAASIAARGSGTAAAMGRPSRPVRPRLQTAMQQTEACTWVAPRTRATRVGMRVVKRMVGVLVLVGGDSKEDGGIVEW